MYRELQPLRQALSAELKATLPPAPAGVEAEPLLQSYLDRLTMYVGCDVADQTLALLAVDAAGEELGHRPSMPNHPSGFEQAWAWLEGLRGQHHLCLMLIAMETSGIYYWAWWDFLTGRPNLARVLYNPRTTEHMTEVLAKQVRNELIDAYALAEQARLGSTPEVVLSEDTDLLTVRLCSRAARDLAQEVGSKKNQLRSLRFSQWPLRTCPVPDRYRAAVNLALHLSLRVPKYQHMYQRIKNRKLSCQGHFTAFVAVARDFVTNMLYDMGRYQRPIF